MLQGELGQGQEEAVRGEEPDQEPPCLRVQGPQQEDKDQTLAGKVGAEECPQEARRNSLGLNKGLQELKLILLSLSILSTLEEEMLVRTWRLGKAPTVAAIVVVTAGTGPKLSATETQPPPPPSGGGSPTF